VNGTAAPANISKIATSLATSIEMSTGTWVVVPMGHLDQPLNTFWQLFFRAKGATRWSDYASALAVATNGGLLLATPDGRTLVVGIRPANLLDYSPLLVTRDAGRTWLPASPVSSLSVQPDALAAEPGGHSLALANPSGRTEVLASSAGLSNWHQLVTANQLASSSSGRSCGLVALTAVGYATGHLLVGGSCRRPGVVGIYSEDQGRWQLVGPALPPSLASGIVDVLGLQKSSGGLWALLSLSNGHGTTLVAARTLGLASPWRLSQVYSLANADHVLSFGPAGSKGLFVFVSGSTSPDKLLLLGRAGAAWTSLPTPPSSTSTVAFGSAGAVDALAVDDTTFTDWRLVPGSVRWTKVQVMNVPIQFGSSG